MREDALGMAAAGLAAGLAAAGLREAVVCPGSRSTPLALALDRHPAIRVWVHLDERSAGYFALGLARGQRRPAAILTTSGTAVANLLPAVMEASHGGGALVVLSADRPPELRQVGASQTVDQVNVFGPAVKASWDLPVPDLAVPGAHWVMAGVRAAAAAAAAPAGPVQVNVPLREPLLPTWPDEGAVPPAAAVHQSILVTDWEALADFGRDEAQGVIVAGAEDLSGAAAAIRWLADQWQWPVWADPLSNLRGRIPAIATYDWLARSLPDAWRPHRILRVGPIPTSKAAGQLMARVPTGVVDHPGRWRDPAGSAAAWFSADLGQWDREVRPELADARRGSAWVAEWRKADEAAQRLLAQRLAAAPPSLSSRWAHELAAVVPDDAVVMVGNSLPVRDLDKFFWGSDRFGVYGNRGVSGIDGVASTGLGIAAGRAQRLVLVVGDLSFLHDANGWLPVAPYGLSATVLVVNNDGGGIFNTLSQASLPPQQFERLFGTPHGLDLAGIAALYGGRYCEASTWRHAAAVLAVEAREPGLSVVDWHTAPRAAYAAWQASTEAWLCEQVARVVWRGAV